jgi:hypothetical protein
MGGNPNPKQKFTPVIGNEAMAKIPLAIRVPVEIDEYVRSLPNRTDWLRQAIAEKIQRETQNAG